MLVLIMVACMYMLVHSVCDLVISLFAGCSC